MLGGRKITATLTGETLEGSVVKCCLQRGILLNYSCEASLLTNSGRDSEMAVIQWGMLYSHQQKIPKYSLTNSSGVLSIEQKLCCKTQLSIHPKKVQYLDQNLKKPRHLKEIC